MPEPATVPPAMFVRTSAYAALWKEWRANNRHQPFNQFIYDALDSLEAAYQRRAAQQTEASR